MKKLVLFFLSLFFIVSCNDIDNEFKAANDTQGRKTVDVTLEKLKLNFAKSLSLSMIESSELRSIIKTKSLEMFNNDYEILFYTIKDLNLTSGRTVESLIKSKFEIVSEYNELLSKMPGLTILIPELPEDSFSAQKWDVSIIPAVAVCVNGSNDVPIIFNDNSVEIIEGKYTPDFPVIVIKNNERVISNFNADYIKYDTREFYNSNGVSFKFLDNEFDFTKNTSNRTVLASNMDQKLINAYTIYNFENPQVSGWHRDFIYYNIQPSTPNGPFFYDYKEHVTSFKMTGNATNAYNKISDQTGEPTTILSTGNINSSHWTSGFFEFKVKTLLNGKNGVGSEIINFITVVPSEIFDLKYKRIIGRFWALESISNKTKSVSLPIFNWDLDEYASSIKITIEEVDQITDVTTTESRTVKFATNFSIDAALGVKVKTGLKFGASLEVTTVNSVTTSYTEGNDQLGDVIVNFADNVIISQYNPPLGSLRYVTREYESGWYSISVEPKRVQ